MDYVLTFKFDHCPIHFNIKVNYTKLVLLNENLTYYTFVMFVRRIDNTYTCVTSKMASSIARFQNENCQYIYLLKTKNMKIKSSI